MQLDRARLTSMLHRLEVAWLLALSCSALTADIELERFKHQKETVHFTIHYDGPDPLELDRMAAQAEDSLRAASRLTGLPIPKARLRLVVCAKGHKSLKEAWPYWGETGAAGTVLAPEGRDPLTILLDASDPDTPTEPTICHEITHALLRTYLKENDSQLPVWLDEGIAQVAACEDVCAPVVLLRAIRKHRTIPLAYLNAPESDGDWDLAYAQGASVVRYIIRTHGKEALHEVLQALADGKELRRALETATGSPVGALETAWFRDAGKPLLEPEGTKNIVACLVVVGGGLAIAVLIRTGRRPPADKDTPEPEAQRRHSGPSAS